MVIEPSCAVPFAALDAQRDWVKGKRIVVIVTGGNVDFELYSGAPALKEKVA
jgi:threonine dehydratase